MLVPLRGARITLAAAETVTAITDTNGKFIVSLRAGTWRANIAHPRFDSLRLTYPEHQLEIPPKAVVSRELWTPSRRMATRILCGDSAKDDDAAVVGIVRDAITHRGIDSASVILKWINLTLRRGQFVRSTATQVAQTTHDGWYVGCAVPANASLVSWAEHGGSTSGIVLLSVEDMPMRLDLSLDATARPSEVSVGVEADSSGGRLFPTMTGTSRYRVFVQDLNGRPVANARVTVLGHRTVRTTETGITVLDSIAGGTQTLEVLAMGYQPQRRVVDIVPNGEPTDTVVLASVRTLLDTIRVIAGPDPTGFERRRAAGDGQFITAADVERADPARTTQLLRTRDGLRFRYDMNGFPYIEVTTQASPCKPLILLDGFPTKAVPVVPGHAAMDWVVHPEEIGGVEIYTTSAKIPAELARWGRACATIALWTRQALGLPKSSSLKP
jgi:hypothetical protein